MGAQSFKDLIVWQKAHELTLKVYKLTIDYPDQEKFGLVAQMRRCSISVPSNISEGFKRRGKYKLNFYNYAQASLEELKYQLLLSRDLNYINNEDYIGLTSLGDEVGRILNKWTSSS